MICPLCQKDMPVLKKDTCVSRACLKKYVRVLFFCAADDVWVSLELPLQQNQFQQGKQQPAASISQVSQYAPPYHYPQQPSLQQRQSPPEGQHQFPGQFPRSSTQ